MCCMQRGLTWRNPWLPMFRIQRTVNKTILLQFSLGDDLAGDPAGRHFLPSSERGVYSLE